MPSLKGEVLSYDFQLFTNTLCLHFLNQEMLRQALIEKDDKEGPAAPWLPRVERKRANRRIPNLPPLRFVQVG